LLWHSLKGANAIKIFSDYGFYHETVKEEKNQEAIHKFISSITIDGQESGGYYFSLGGDTILEFYRDRELIEILGMPHGTALRWDG